MIKNIFKKSKLYLLVIVLGIISTIILTWPLTIKLNDFYYDRGDYPVSGSTLVYNANALINGRIFSEEYFHGFQYYPLPFTLLYSDLRLTPTLIFGPIFLISQKFILSLNLTLMITFILSFLTSFITCNYFTKNKSASLIGAIVFTFNPLTFSRLPEHFELLNKYCLPLVFLFCYQFFNFPNLKNAFYFGLFFTLNAFTAIYFQLFTILILPFWAASFFLINFYQQKWPYIFKLIKLTIILLIFLPVILYFNNHYLLFSQKEMITRQINENIYFSARLIDYLSSNKTNFLYGKWTAFLDPFRSPKDSQGNFNYLEHTLFLNIIPFILLIISLWAFRKNKNYSFNRPLLISLWLILILTFILTFGPYFQGSNEINLSTRLPFYYLYQWLPFLQGVRAPTRVGFLFYVPFSVLCAIGTTFLLSKFKKRSFRVIITSGILFLLVLENFNADGAIVSFQETSKMIPMMEDYQQKKINLSFLKDKTTLHLPLYIDQPGLDSIYLNWSIYTQEKIMNGNSGYLPTDQLTFLTQLNKNFDKENLKKIQVLGVDYLIVYLDLLRGKNLTYPILEQLTDAITFQDDQLVIYDLQKNTFNIRHCNFDQDITSVYQQALLPDSLQKVNLLQIKNSGNCYLPNIYLNRYHQITVQDHNFLGNKIEKTIDYRLPVLIEPNQMIILSDLNNEIRVASSP